MRRQKVHSANKPAIKMHVQLWYHFSKKANRQTHAT